MTAIDPPTERTGPLTLLPRHLTDGAPTWWFHTLIHTITFLIALSVWHVRYEWHQLTLLDRTAIISGSVLAMTAVTALLYH